MFRLRQIRKAVEPREDYVRVVLYFCCRCAMDTTRMRLVDATNALSIALSPLECHELMKDGVTYEERLERAREACLLLQKEVVGIDFLLCSLASRAQAPYPIPSPWDKRRRPDLDEDTSSPKRAEPDVPMVK